MRNHPAWREGYKAYNEGTATIDSPYNSEDDRWAYWMDGWKIAEDDDFIFSSFDQEE